MYVTLAMDLGANLFQLAHVNATEEIRQRAKAQKGVPKITNPSFINLAGHFKHGREFFSPRFNPAGRREGLSMNFSRIVYLDGWMSNGYEFMFKQFPELM